MKRGIFITGAAGLVGTALLKSISEEDCDIVALYRRHKSINRPNVKWINADVTDPSIDIRKYLDSSSILIHNAAVINRGSTPIERELIQMNNIDFTQKLFDAAIECGVEKVIFTSSFSLIERPLPSIITEEAAITARTNFYAESKLIGEAYLRKKALDFNIQYNILRLSSPISFSLDLMPDNVVKMWISKSIRKETLQVYGSGKRTQDFVAVQDVASAFKACLFKHNVSGTFNIASGVPMSMLDLAKIITSKFGNDFVHGEEDPNELERWNISIDKARREIGYLPVYTSKECITKLLDGITK